MERLDFDSELLEPLKNEVEIILNRLMGVCSNGNKEAEINLKINLSAETRREFNRGQLTKEWKEPHIEYQLAEKIKEVKTTNKGSLGFDYEMKVNQNTNEVFIQKINEQLSLLEGGRYD